MEATATLKEKSQEVTLLLKALSHECRLLTVCFVAEGEKSVYEIEKFTSLSQSSVSQHLAKLRHQNILKTRKVGNIVYYSIFDEKIAKLITNIQHIFCIEKL